MSAASRTPPRPGLPLASSPGLWEGVTTARSAGWCPAQPGPSPQLRPCTQSPGFRLPRGCFYKPRLSGKPRSWEKLARGLSTECSQASEQTRPQDGC